VFLPPSHPPAAPLGLLSRHALVALVAALCALLLTSAPRLQAALGAGRLAAATEHPACTQEAIAQMRAGGNAVDAAVSAALVAGVVSPTSSGLGGGGFALAWLAADRRAYLLDFRETAPQGMDVAAFEQRPLPEAQRGKLVGVPGELRGLFTLQRKLGRRRWQEVVAPAIRLAKAGFAVGRHLGETLRSQGGRLRRDPGLAAVFYPGGRPAAVGKLLTNPKLAATLEQVAAGGATPLYEGPIAADLVQAASSAGGALALGDLRAYQPVERGPLHVRWEGHDIYTMPPPSAGGLMLAQTLTMLSRAELSRLGHNSGAYQHLLAEVARAAIADRMRFLGDPGHMQVAVSRLLDRQRLAERRRSIALDRTHAIPRFGLEAGGTHALVTADAGGNWVSLTTTVNTVFGAELTGRQSGVILNDQLDDFTQRKDVQPFNMTQSPNRPRPGARPVSSMTPTIVVRDGRAVLVLGGSGGPAIATNVTQLVLSHLVFGLKPAAAVKAARFYIPTHSAFIWLERGAAPALVADLQRRGEIVGTAPSTKSAVQMIALCSGLKAPAADPRKYGSALAQ
jgi:gamma-glutamyltranspeptidase/glutathione hydrolase